MTVAEYKATEAEYKKKMDYMNRLAVLATPILQKQMRAMFGGEQLTNRELAIVQLAEEATERLRPVLDQMMVALSQPYLEK